MSTRDQPGPSDHRVDDEMSAYERERLKNIQEIYEQFSELFENVQKSAETLQTDIKSSSAPVKSEVKTNGRVRARNFQRFKLGSRPKKLIPNDNDHQSTRLSGKRKQTNYKELSDSDDEPKKKKEKIKIPFVGGKTSRIRIKIKRRTCLRKPCKERKILLVSDVTQEMLSNIVYKPSGKILSDSGTTCHQCRQKTLDQKSCCRNNLCRGVRGMFCGFCLRNRYGEDVADVLKNPNWTCPVCRKDCNCSICRRKRGQGPTGPMVQLATACGYKSVRHYLNENDNKLLQFSSNPGLENDNLKDLNSVEQKFTDNIKSENKIVYEQLDSPEIILNKLYQELFSSMIKEDEFELQ